MISVDRALEIVLANTTVLGSEKVDLRDAMGRVLRQQVKADTDLPPFDRARMDGYAVRSTDVQTVPARLQVKGEVAAGFEYEDEVKQGQAVKIFTGAPVPPGADAVQRVEVTESKDGVVTINETVSPGQFITPRASEVTVGQIVAEAGEVIGPAEMAVLASFGYSRVEVGLRPRVTVLSTGSELVEVSESPTGAQIRNSNTYTISAYAERDGALVHTLGIVKDEAAITRSRLEKAARDSDIVITSGGVSMGDYDLVEASLKEIGAQIFFDRVSIRPGKPTVFARLENTYFFCLPGNPVSTSVTYNVFVRPALRTMQGDFTPLLPGIPALSTKRIKDDSNRRSYLPARLYIDSGRAMVEPLKWGGSSDFVAFMRANALIIVHEDTNLVEAGQEVDCLSLRA